MTRISLAIVLIAVALIVYFGFREKQNPAAPEEILVTLDAHNNSGEYGTASLTEENGVAKVVVTLVGAPADLLQPAHIHEGTCAALGAPRYQLKFPLNGESETLLDVSLTQLLEELPLAVNVHKSVAEATEYVSCGNITAPQ